MKKYKILKDIPGFKAGDIIPTDAGDIGTTTIYSFDGESIINENYAKKYPDFFEEIIEDKTYDTLEKGDEVYYLALDGTVLTTYFDIKSHSRGEIFLTNQEAEDEKKRREWMNRKDKFIPEQQEPFWFPSSELFVMDTIYLGSHSDIFHVNSGLAFRTKKECEDAIKNNDIVRLFYTVR